MIVVDAIYVTVSVKTIMWDWRLIVVNALIARAVWLVVKLAVRHVKVWKTVLYSEL